MFSDIDNIIFDISIHALRVEGDGCDEKFFKDIKISIHALRVEGDSSRRLCTPI